jgi:hypothetical protein
VIKKILLYLPIVALVIGFQGEISYLSGDDVRAPAEVSRTKPSEEMYEVIYGRGCCSRHGGQCGCRKGNVVCCDGTLSPSCGC